MRRIAVLGVVLFSMVAACSGSDSGLGASPDASVDAPAAPSPELSKDAAALRRELRAHPLELKGPRAAALPSPLLAPSVVQGSSLVPAAPAPAFDLQAQMATVATASGFKSSALSRALEPLGDAGRYAMRRRELSAFFHPKGFALTIPERRKADKPAGGWNVLVDVVGGSEVTPIAEAARAARTHRFGAVVEDLPQFGQLAWEEIYPGVDMVVGPSNTGFSYRFIASPGADLARIKLAWKGAESLRVSEDGGTLEIKTGVGTLKVDALRVYEVVGGEKHELAARHVAKGLESGFEVTGWTGKGPLVIDPSVWWASYLGDTGVEDPGKLAVDASGNVYVVGTTNGSGFPTTGGYDTTIGSGTDAFVSKFSNTGSLTWSTYLGGNGADYGNDIAIDGSGAPVVVGETWSSGMATAGVYDTTITLSEAFVAKLTSTNGGPTWFTYLGGSSGDSARGVAIDAANNIYVTGTTNSSDFPRLSAFRSTYAGGSEGFLTKLTSSGGAVFSTFIGGSSTDRGNAVAVDGSSVYVTGTQDGSSFNGLGAGLGYSDGFLTKFSQDGTHQWSTYVGGSGGDEANGVTVMPTSGRIVVVGVTGSSNFPADNYSGGGTDAFIATYSTTGTLYSAKYLGGSVFDGAYDVVGDAAGAVYIVGATGSANFPNVGGLSGTLVGDDAFLVKTDEVGLSYTLSTRFPDGGGATTALSVALDASKNIFVLAQANGSMPLTPNPSYDYTWSGNEDAWIYAWPAPMANGSACRAGGMCTSSQCVDQVCCATACTAKCMACTLAKTGSANGTCAPVTSGSDPDFECAGASCASGALTVKSNCNGAGACTTPAPTSCSPYICNGSADCKTVCMGSWDCATNFYCSSYACIASKANGSTCTDTRECLSGNCVVEGGVGTCCDTACTGDCSSCKAASKASGADGTCGPIKAGTDPKDKCTTNAGYPGNCQSDGMCDGAGACRTYATSGTVCVAQSCAAGTVSNTQTCNGSGVCSALTTTSCGGYACTGASCQTGCSSDSQCTSSYYCSAGACTPKLSNGTACTAANQCSTGNCVDGVCCDTGCVGTCVACTAAKKGSGVDGTCGNIIDGIDPDEECLGDSCAGSTMSFQVCNGAAACRTKAVACAPYVCNAGGTACAKNCTSDLDCGADSYCGAGGLCTPRLAQGVACGAANQCRTGLFCVDGFCCDKPCDGSCEACSTTVKGQGVNGTCGPIKADLDPKNKCAPTSGYPGNCAADGLCDGTGSCRTYAKPGVECAAASCAGGSLLSARTCDGGGGCQAASVTASCGAYQCNVAGTLCVTSCSSSADCAGGYYCDGTSKCVAKKANAVACSTNGECTSGACVDSVCCNDACTGKCNACTAAKKGTGVDGTCGVILDGRDPDGECGVTACASGSLTVPVCNGAGSCRAQVTSCAPYGCNGSSSCLTTCTADTDCATTAYCDATSHCVAKKTQGSVCSAKKECQTGNCVDGFCCDDPCTGGCMACSTAVKGSGANGVCGPVAVDTDPKSACTPGAGYPSSCAGDGFCDGTGSCRTRAKTGTVCASPGCEAGSLTSSRTCDASGLCQPATVTASCGAYQCAGSVCATSCATSTECSTGYYCNASSQCVTKKTNGAVCGTAAECTSGSCIDGFCCDTACGGKCEACSAAKKGGGVNGTCGAIGDGRDPDGECGVVTCVSGSLSTPVCNGTGSCRAAVSSCAPYGCAPSGGACLGSTCTSDSECASTAFCDKTLGCTTKKTNGATCGAKNECQSGSCVDGVCCDTACTGGCVACTNALKGGGSDGVCDSIKAGTDPKSSCTAGPGYPADCSSDGMCDGAGACRAKAASGTQCAAPSCASGSLVSARTCDAVGTCQAAAVLSSCGAYGCDGSACATGCTTDATCSASTYCSGGSCVTKKSNGTSCGANNECSSAHCADGVCCDTACGGKCEACTTTLKGSGVNGVCGAIADGADPQDECTGDTCVSGTLTVQVCDGSRACRGKSSSCGAFGCNTTADACLKSCATDDECGADYYCNAAKECARRKGAGTACGVRNECKSGLFCADGVCCDQACNGQCQACNEKGSEGSCVAVLGAPRGTRTACKGDGSACNGACDGINGGACVFPTASISCGDGCKDSKLSVCDGAGTCLSATACPGNLTCDGTKACRAACADDTHCNAGFRCLEGKCSPKPTSTCSADGLSSVSAESGTSRPCAPYRCGPGGGCLDTCATSADCAPGSLCDTSTAPAHCSPAASGGTDEGGGCALGGGSTGSSSKTGAAGLAFMVAALVARARRRRSLRVG